MNASTKTVFPPPALTVSAVTAFLITVVLVSPPDFLTLLVISAIAVLPFGALLIIAYFTVRRRRIHLGAAASIGVGLGIGIASVMMSAVIVRVFFTAPPPDEIRAAQQGAAGNGSMVVCCEYGRVSLAVARA